MSKSYGAAWSQIAADIAAEKRTAPTAGNTTDRLVSILARSIVEARLALSGITDPATVEAVSKRVTVQDDGSVVGLDAQGRPGVGSGANYHMTVEDVARDLGATAKASTASPGKAETAGQVNPFVKGPNFNFTMQAILRKTDPELADHFEYLASMGK